MADTTLKFKRGQESKVNSLAKEDGSVIFGINNASSPSTLHLDSTVGDSVQRLGVAVASASSANTASTATKLRTARKINDASFDGTKDVDITELHPVVITDQSVDLNTLRLTGDFLGRKLYLCGTDGGSSKITHKPETANEGFILLVEQLRWYNGSTDYVNKQTLEYGTSHKVYVRYSSGVNWGSWVLQSDDGIASTANYAKNSGALGGSSLSQVLASAGGGSAFVGLDTTTNNVVKLTRANGGTVQKTINNVSHATSASIATTANIAKALPATVTLGSGNEAMIDQNGANYRQRIRIEDNASANDNVFVFQQSANAGSTYTDLFRILDNGTVVANTFTGALNGTANYAKNSGQLQGYSLTTSANGTSATFANKVPLIHNNTLEISRYIDFHGDGTSRDYSVRLDTGTPSKLIVSGPSASTVQAGYFQGVAQNSNALGGSSLSQVLSYASSRVSSSSYLNNYFTSRQTSANVAINGKGGLRTFKATSTMTTGKPTIGDSHILHFDWDNTGGYDSQIAVAAKNPHIQIRSQDTGTWSAWTDILDQNNYTKYIPLRTKTINAGFSTAFRTQTQGSTAQGSFLSMIRNNAASVANAPQHGSGLAWGHSDTHGYLYTNYSSAHAYIGGGNANKLNWVKELVFTDTKISNASTADYAKNSAALGGSSLSQILASAGGGKYLPLAGGTMTGTLNFSNGVGITGTMASNDQWRIIGGGSSDSGYLEIATRDNANEPIYVRQYTAFTSTGLKRTATLLDGNGNTSFPGRVSASTLASSVIRGPGELIYRTNSPQLYQLIDLSSTATYDSNTWYPILGSGIPYGGFTQIGCHVQLNSGTKPSWSTHNSGFTCNLDVLAKAAGWGTTAGESIIRDYSWRFTSNNVSPISYEQLGNSSRPVIYMRGGGKYRIYTSNPISWQIITAATTLSQQSIKPESSCPALSIYKSTVYANLNGTASSASNASALGGSSLSQILAQSGSGNAFTALDTATSNVVKLTRANGGTVQKTIDNVSHATSANNSDKLDGYSENSFLRYRGSSGTNFDNSLWDQIGIKEYDNAYPDGLTDGKYNYGEVISLPSSSARFDLWVNHFSSSGTTNGIQYRSGWNDDKKSWRMILDSVNYISYAADKTAFTGIDTTTNSVIKLTRANGGTVQKTINNVAHATSADRLGGYGVTTSGSGTSATFASKVPLILSGGVLEISRYIDFHGDTTSRDYSVRLDTGTASKLVVTGPSASTVTASYFDGVARNSNQLGGHSSTYFVSKAELGSGSSTGSMNVDAARRIVNSTVNTRNAQSFRVGTPGSGSWTGFPSSYLYSASSTAALKTNAYYRNQVGVLHVAAGTAYHDLVFADAGTDNGIVRVSSKGDTGLILDTTNYATYSTRYNALSSSTLTVTTAGGVNIDGGSY